MTIRAASAALLLLLLAACGQQGPDRDAALLDELRAMRQEQAAGRQQQALSDELSRWTAFLAASGRLPNAAPSAPASPSTTPVAAAPQQPQSPSASSPPPVDAALTARVAALENELRAAAERQRDAEAAMARALDGTTVHVERILTQLQQLAVDGALATPLPAAPVSTSRTPPPERSESQPDREPSTGTPTTPSATPVTSSPTKDAGTNTADPAGTSEPRESAFQRGRWQSYQAWLIAVLTVGLGAIVLLAWRLLHRSPPQPERHAEPEPAARGDMTTDELWAAAGLLSEAVGRLRGAVPPSATTPEALEPAVAPAPPQEPSTAPPPDLGDDASVDVGVDLDAVDEVFVLDEERSLLRDVDWSQLSGRDPSTAPPPPTPAAAPVPEPAVGEPARWTMMLAVTDHVLARATIDAYLSRDPRVLRVPAPTVRSLGDGIEVTVALLPGLLAGEREHLRSTLQRLLQQN